MHALRRWWDTRTAAPRAVGWRDEAGILRSAVLEVNAAEHCNLSCRACSHLSPLASRHVVEPEALAHDLALLAPHYRTAELRFVGGEPLLHPRLAELVAVVRRSEIATRIVLVTNGVLLERMPAELWDALDRVEVSSYPGSTLDTATRRTLAGRASAAGTGLRFRHVGEFRESHSTVGTVDDALVAQIHGACDLRDYHTLAAGTLYRCPQSYFLPKLLEVDAADGLALGAGEDLAERLRAFLAAPEPLAACRHCLGTSGRRFPHAQIQRSAFAARQARPTEELVDRRYLRRRSVLRRLSSATR